MPTAVDETNQALAALTAAFQTPPQVVTSLDRERPLF